MKENLSARSDKPGIVARVEELIQPLLVAQGVELVEVEYSRPRQGRAILRLYLDREGGITLEELARLSRVVSQLLDVHDPIPGSYTLEVSSPGLTRALKKPADYQRYVGRLVRLTTRTAINGRQVHRGILQGLADDKVCLKVDDEETCIPVSEIAKARLDIDLKNIGKEG
jgi:ribosome maturation factor RimP